MFAKKKKNCSRCVKTFERLDFLLIVFKTHANILIKKNYQKNISNK